MCTSSEEKQKLEGALLMARTMCHEMAQPLQAIVGYAEIIKYEHEQGTVKEENIQELIAQVMRLDRTLKQTYDIVRLKTEPYPTLGGEPTEVINLNDSMSFKVSDYATDP